MAETITPTGPGNPRGSRSIPPSAVASAFLGILAFAAALGAWLWRGAGLVLFFAAAVLALLAVRQARTARQAIRQRAGGTVGGVLTLGGLSFSLLGLAVVLALPVFVYLTSEHWPPPYQTQAVGALRVLDAALAEYQRAHPERGFARSLEELGPNGAKLIDGELAAGRSKGYLLSYRPGPPDAKGVVTTYSITARPVKYGVTGHIGFYTDQSGVRRFAPDDREPTAQDQPLQ